MQRNRKVTHTLERTNRQQTAYDSDQVSDLIGKHFKVALINMFTVKENLIKRRKRRYDDKVASNREYQRELFFLRNQMEILELKSTITKIKISLEKPSNIQLILQQCRGLGD